MIVEFLEPAYLESPSTLREVYPPKLYSDVGGEATTACPDTRPSG
jgi:hypothetical protein